MKTKRILLIMVAAASMATPLCMSAQSHSGSQNRSGYNTSFDEFRRQIIEGYNNYRNQVLDNYANFLDGIWDDYTQFQGVKRDNTPKPSQPPIVELTPINPSKPTKPSETAKPDLNTKPSETAKPDLNTKPSETAKPDLNTKPSETAKPDLYKPTQPNLYKDSFDFYGLPVTVARIDFDIRNSINSKEEYGRQWKELDKGKVSAKVLPQLMDAADNMGLNDYLKFRLVKSYVDSKFKGYPASTRLSLVHYLMANAGYDVRIALGNGTIPMLLIPTEQQLYARPYMELNGRKYFVFSDDENVVSRGGMTISTCRLPSDADAGKAFDMRLGQLNLPYSPKPYNISFGDITITGETNANLYPMLYQYPQMPIADYVTSSPDPKVRNAVAEQVARALKSKDPHTAIDDLLHFVQSGFVYATDEDNHGFEKPYFFEEMLYYDKCDCEDRAIFYTYLLWNVLGTKCHLITYPGHESVAVSIPGSSIEGTSYRYDGSTYYISDPTYIGSNTGMCMPNYRSNKPEIDYEYK